MNWTEGKKREGKLQDSVWRGMWTRGDLNVDEKATGERRVVYLLMCFVHVM